MKNYTFRVIIEPDENNAFHGFVPSLPGCHTWGYSIEETRKNLKEAIKKMDNVLNIVNDRMVKLEKQGPLLDIQDMFAEVSICSIELKTSLFIN